MAQKIQTVLFSKEESPSEVNEGAGWTRSAASAWLTEHDLRAPEADETDNQLRYRQFDPDLCEGGFQTLTQNFPAGVSAVTCERTAGRSERRFAAERRTLPVQDAELRVEDVDGSTLIQGFAARFDVRSLELGFGQEIVRPGAFTKTLQEADPPALWNHDPNFVLGRRSSKSLELREEERGLRARIVPPDAQWARDFTESIRRGDVTGMSFGFRTLKDRWTQDESGAATRELLEVELLDVSPATFPAYPQTEVFVRSLLGAEGLDWRQLQRAYRDEGLTSPEIRVMVDREMRALGQRFPEPDPAIHSNRAANQALQYRRELDLVEL